MIPPVYGRLDFYSSVKGGRKGKREVEREQEILIRRKAWEAKGRENGKNKGRRSKEEAKGKEGKGRGKGEVK